MGVKFLTHHHEKINARLPFTLNKADLLKHDYTQMGTGVLKTIGIDGNIFLHSYTLSRYDLNQNATFIAEKILDMVEKILNFFSHYNEVDGVIILHIVVDSTPPLPKNRSEKKKPDYYSTLQLDEKEVLQERIVDCIKKSLDSYQQKIILQDHKLHQQEINLQDQNILQDQQSNLHQQETNLQDQQSNLHQREIILQENKQLDDYSQLSASKKQDLHNHVISRIKQNIRNQTFIKLLTNVKQEIKREGEITLYSFCNDINKKYNNDTSIRNVIVTSDSDVVAMMNFNEDKSLVIVSNICGHLYILNHDLICKALDVTSQELITYTLLHFIYFGSDYNLGLVYPTESKQAVIMKSVKNKVDDINVIGRAFTRKKRKLESEEPDYQFLEQLKKYLVVEALSSVLYYKSLGDETYLKFYSPQIYMNPEIKKYVSLITFSR